MVRGNALSQGAVAVWQGMGREGAHWGAWHRAWQPCMGSTLLETAERGAPQARASLGLQNGRGQDLGR